MSKNRSRRDGGDPSTGSGPALSQGSGHLVVGLFVLTVAFFPQPVQRVGRARRGEPLRAAEGDLVGTTIAVRHARSAARLRISARRIRPARRLAERGGRIRGPSVGRDIRAGWILGGRHLPLRGRLLPPPRLGLGVWQAEGDEPASEYKETEEGGKRSKHGKTEGWWGLLAEALK